MKAIRKLEQFDTYNKFIVVTGDNNGIEITFDQFHNNYSSNRCITLEMQGVVVATLVGENAKWLASELAKSELKISWVEKISVKATRFYFEDNLGSYIDLDSQNLNFIDGTFKKGTKPHLERMAVIQKYLETK